jgi:hypothetical protein
MTKIIKNKYGKYSNEIEKILEKITNFSLDDRSRLDAAADAATDAATADAATADATRATIATIATTADAAYYDAAYHAADAAYYDAAAAADYAAFYRDNWWKFRVVFWYAILAWLAKDKITGSQFDLVMTGYNAYIKSENA